MIFFIIFGAIVIVSVFVLISWVIIKAWFKLIDSLQKDQKKIIKSKKQDGIKFLCVLLQTNYDTQKYDVIVRVSIISIVLCAMTLWLWFSVGSSFI
jgi:hypothetical protein